MAAELLFLLNRVFLALPVSVRDALGRPHAPRGGGGTVAYLWPDTGGMLRVMPRGRGEFAFDWLLVDGAGRVPPAQGAAANTEDALDQLTALGDTWRAALTAASTLTEARFLTILSESPCRLELLNGRIFAMAGAHPRHGAMVANLLRALDGKLGPGCRVVASDQAVTMPSTYRPARPSKRSSGPAPNNYVFPDVVGFCAGSQFQPEHPYALANPMLLVEVSSGSTSDRDEQEKLLSYQGIPSLKHYLIVRLTEPSVDVWTRGESGWTQVRVEGDGVVVLLGAGVEVSLAAIYDGLDGLPPLPS